MDDRQRLRRAQLIERVRTVEKANAARVSAEAEALSHRLAGVAAKTQLLARHYAETDGVVTGADLRRQSAMRVQIHHLGTMNEAHLRDARGRADAALVSLGSAERKRARIESDRRALEAMAAAKAFLIPT